MKKMLLFGLLLSGSLLSAQSKQVYPLLFKAQTIDPSAVQYDRPTVVDGMRYVIVQHPELAIAQDFYGFETLEYLPKHSAFARVAEENFAQAQNKLHAAGGISINIKPAWKLSLRLSQADYPDWAWLGDERMHLVLRYWPGLTHQSIVKRLEQEGFEVLESTPSERLVAVAAQPQNSIKIAELPYISYLQAMEHPGEPENFTARTNHRVNSLQQPGNGGLSYAGSGIVIGHNDAGELSNHIDYKGRLTDISQGGAGSDHGDHTAGTIFGAGNRDPEAKGMAYAADMFYDNYPGNFLNADSRYNSQNIRLTSNSFSNGCNAGYTSYSARVDKDAADNPNLLHVFSAGNNGNSNCGYGAGNGWGNITGGHKQGKNAVTVANLDLFDGLASSSSRGPAHDGRIKPDIGAVGTNVLSTTDANGPNTYNRKTGTSMSCPGITGSLAILMEAFKDHNSGKEPKGALMKGILLNGADDIGNPGPDFRFGYGRVNVRKSYQMIAQAQYFTDSLGSGDSLTYSISVPGNLKQLKVMLIWADPDAAINTSRALVNDLDLSLELGGSQYQPWVLDPTPNATNLNKNATRSRDSLNNMEQITIENPSSGTSTVTVRGYDIPQGKQRFHLVYYFEEDDIVITYPQTGGTLSNTGVIRWDGPSNNGSFKVELSQDGGATWSVYSNATNNHFFNLTTGPIMSDQVYLRVSNNSDTAITGPFTMTQTPMNLRVVKACPDSLSLNWDSVPSASGYVVYKLGAKYMDSVTYVQSNSAMLANDAGKRDWFAVATVLNDTSVGRRSQAIFKKAGVRNCALPRDLAVSRVLSPGNGEISDCFNASALPITVEVTNNGTDTVYAYDLSFRRQGQVATTESVSDTVAPGGKSIYTFSSASLNLINNFLYNYQFWVDYATDANPYNDTLRTLTTLYSSNNTITAFPHVEDFESFSRCSNNTNCGNTLCPLNNGWFNNTTGVVDESDWRTWAGSTSSNGTGPSFDHNPGNSGGQYLYAESSGGCDSSTLIVNSPCIDLDTLYNPEARIWYHMYGSNMGTFNVDVFDGNRWHYQVVSELSGSQGAAWSELKIDLQPYAGKMVMIRFRGKIGDGFRSDMAIDDFAVYDRSGIGLEERQLTYYRVYPNPSNGQFTLERPADKATVAQWRITDLRGATVQEGKFSGKSIRIDLQEQAKGMYLLQVEDREGGQNLRLIKQ